MCTIVALKSLSTAQVVKNTNKKLESELIQKMPRKVLWSDKRLLEFKRKVWVLVRLPIFHSPITA